MQGKKGIKRSESHLAILGHELRNALNGVISVTELLGGSGLSGEQQQLHKALQQSGRQLHWLIESVDPGGRKAEFPFTPVPGELNGIDLLEQAIRCHTPAATLKNNLLLLTVEPGLPVWWQSDVRLLRQVIDNLLGNAIKFTRSGLVEVEVRRAQWDHDSDSGLELLVHDNGPGISMDDSSQIFEPWVQLDDDKNREGVGLGLHVCRRIVSRLNGILDYCCHTRVGHCFRVCLPGVIDARSLREAQPASRLYSNILCLISVRDDLSASIEALLARLGVRARSCRKENFAEAGSDLEIRISEAQIYPEDSSAQNGLLFTLKTDDSQSRTLSGSRRLQAPFLESTLGPLLLEMALEWRLAKRNQSSLEQPGTDPATESQ